MDKSASVDCDNASNVATPSQLGSRIPNLPAQEASGGVIDRRRLQELVKEIDPLEQIDEDVEEVTLCTLI